MKISCSHDKVVDLDLLVENPKNPNKHPEKQIKYLAKIMAHQGWRHPITVSNRSGFIVAGHGRMEAARLNGWTEAPVDYQDFDMELLGIPDFEMPEEPDPAKEEIEDDVPKDVETRCKEGDLWQLGEHRLLCGDATNIQHVERLMGGDKADMVFTDPPYGMNAVSKNGQVGGGTKAVPAGKYKPVHGDENTDIARDCFNLLMSLEFPVIVYWGANYYTDFVPPTSGWIYWHKERSEGLTLSDGELAWTNQDKPLRCHKVRWDGYNREGERNQKRVHPTQKPILLAEKCFNDYKNIKSVLDLFGGSGSTLIACEKTNRKCYMMELDPHYCDVILKRWEDYSGQTAERIT